MEQGDYAKGHWTLLKPYPSTFYTVSGVKLVGNGEYANTAVINLTDKTNASFYIYWVNPTNVNSKGDYWNFVICQGYY